MDLELARESIDQKVVYDPRDGSPSEDGVIDFVTERFVFVRYGNDTAPKATDPAALSLILVGASGAEYVLDDPIGLAPEPGSVCDAADWGQHPSQAVIGGQVVCRCTVCPRCHHHTGNAHQGHYWAFCKVTRTTREPHMCCPDPEFGCALEAAFAVDMGFMSLPTLERFVVACPQCGSRDEYTRPDPPEHTCGHMQPTAEMIGSSMNPTPDCGYQPRTPRAATEVWWCSQHAEFHQPKETADV